MRHKAILVLLLPWLLVGACDRNLEPFDPEERPRPPDLTRIFPAGAERAQQPAAPETAGAGPPAAGGRGAPPVASGEPIRGSVRLGPDVASGGEGVLFVIARSGSAGPPLAVKRIERPRFPLEFELGPEDRMIQQMPFVGPLVLVARLDRDGSATTRSPGDLQGSAKAPVSPGARGIEIVLDEVVR